MLIKLIILYNFIAAGVGMFLIPMLSIGEHAKKLAMIFITIGGMIGIFVFLLFKNRNKSRENNALFFTGLLCMCVSTCRWYFVDFLEKEAKCGLFVITTGTMLLLIMGNVGRIRQGYWNSSLEKFLNYTGCLIGIPLLAFSAWFMVKYIIDT